MPHLPTTAIGEYELTDREIAAIKFICEYRAQDPFGRAPTHKELMLHLGRVLPKRKDGKPSIYSKQQTQRIVDHLRELGLLVGLANSRRTSRTMVPTKSAEKLVARAL